MPMRIALLFAFFALPASSAVAGQRYTSFADPTFPFFGLSVDASPGNAPRSNWVPRGVVVRVSEGFWALYDVDLIRLAAVWRGGFPQGVTIAQHSYQNTNKKAGGGQKSVPRFEGRILSSTGMYPGIYAGTLSPNQEDPRDRSPDEDELGRGPVDFQKFGRWRGVELQGEETVVVFESAGGTIREGLRPLLEGAGFSRTFSFTSLKEAIFIALGEGVRPRVGGACRLHSEGEQNFAVIGPGSGTGSVMFGKGGLVPANKKPGAARWPHEVVTRGTSGQGGKVPYVKDRIALPLKNPWRRAVRPSSVAFFEDGRAALSTVDGDVWIVSGLGKALSLVSWRRFTSGLHEPYSISIRDGEVFIFDRSGLKRLHDRNGDGEADFHEWFCHDFWQSAETRDFPHDMALRPDGGFYLIKGGQQNDHLSKHSGRVISVSNDGESAKVFSSGHRNGFLGIDNGSGDLFACDQQGHWVPATPVQQLRKGGYYGFKPAAPHGIAEPAIAPPLTWLPHRAAQSAVDIIAGADERLGGLEGSLVCVDYFRPGLLKVFATGAGMRLGEAFEFPLLKGAINPRDGHLYLVGFQIWGTASKDPAGFGRLRRDSTVVDGNPADVIVGRQGILLRFDKEIDPVARGKISRYHLQAWDYRRSAGYGSGHFRNDGSAGQDPVGIAGVHVSDDKRSLFIHVPVMPEADQMQMVYSGPGVDGRKEEQTIYLTPLDPGNLDLVALGFKNLELQREAATVRSTGVRDVQEAASMSRGETISITYGCIACHSTDGSTEGKTGPSWAALHGSRREFIDGKSAVADDAYLREAILNPAARIIKGYNPKDVGMPSYRGILSERDIESVLMFIKSLAGE
ncbi:MAG: c-type cytochrome [Verrucomicrobiaceae bacterium]|nr:c-type cytochrome [Verrucomicrobiaceae bacterium]